MRKAHVHIPDTTKTAGAGSRAAGLLVVTAVALMVCVGGLSGCRDDRSDKPPRQFFPDLDDQYKEKAQSESVFYKEFVDPETGEVFGRAMRVPPAGVVAYGDSTHAGPVATADGGTVDVSKRAEKLGENDVVYTGRLGDGAHVNWIPIAVTSELIEKGRENYGIYCMPCHGGLGDGKGLVGRRWAYGLPNWHEPRYKRGGEKGQDGLFFATIREGVKDPGGGAPKMSSYATKVSVEESWGIVAYIRALQHSQSGSIGSSGESADVRSDGGGDGGDAGAGKSEAAL